MIYTEDQDFDWGRSEGNLITDWGQSDHWLRAIWSPIKGNLITDWARSDNRSRAIWPLIENNPITDWGWSDLINASKGWCDNRYLHILEDIHTCTCATVSLSNHYHYSWVVDYLSIFTIAANQLKAHCSLYTEYTPMHKNITHSPGGWSHSIHHQKDRLSCSQLDSLS